MWLAVHPENTRTARCPDEDGAPTFEFGFWPPRIAERLDICFGKIRKKTDGEIKELDLISDRERLELAINASYDLVCDMVRYSVRGWTGLGDLKPELETVKIDGRDHVRLTDGDLRVIYANQLLPRLAEQALLFNRLTETEKKTFGWPSASAPSNSPTPAGSATPPGTESPSGSSDSKTKSSTDAPTS